LPPLLLEQLALDELEPDQVRSVRERLGSDAEATLAELRGSDAEIADALPVAALAREVERRRERGAPARVRRGLWIAVPALACLALLILRPGDPESTTAAGGASSPGETLIAPADDGVRLKGFAPQIRLYRRTGGEPEQLADGSSAGAGDVVQIRVLAAGHRAGLILSLDGRGEVTVHLPLDPSASEARPFGDDGETLLEDAFELDDAPGFERFVLVTADDPFAVAPIVAAAQALARDGKRSRSAPLELPEGFDQASVLLVKEEL